MGKVSVNRLMFTKGVNTFKLGLSGFAIVATVTGVAQTGGFGAPAGVQVTKRMVWLPSVLLFVNETVIKPSVRTRTYGTPVCTLEPLIEIGWPQFREFVHGARKRPVSYTHLDVYKRQSRCGPRAWGRSRSTD